MGSTLNGSGLACRASFAPPKKSQEKLPDVLQWSKSWAQGIVLLRENSYKTQRRSGV